MNTREPVAIVGIGCRFPGGAADAASFARLLESGREAIGPMPAGRFGIDRLVDPEPRKPGRVITAQGGFLDGIDEFDAAFFGISPREARKMDPQHRLLLEVVWESLEDAGIPAASLAGSRSGVFAGLWSGEYEHVMARDLADMDLYAATGGGRYAAAGRVSFTLDLRGPSMTVDTACSSSLVAMHLAARALQTGDCDLAIAGAANLILQPYVSVAYSRSGMLSRHARCRFGAPDPDGYVRSEGAAAVVLKRLADAVRDRDPIHAVVMGSAVNSDGRGSDRLVAPSREAQAAMLREAYADAGIDPRMVDYVEAHGTGTLAGDSVELGALGEVIAAGRTQRLPVGSIKQLIGHAEAASGFAGVIKAIIAMRRGVVPAAPSGWGRSDAIQWDALNVEIPETPVSLPSERPAVIGVNSFGVTGTNAHVVLAAPPRTASPHDDEGRPHVVAISGATVEALNAAAARLKDHLGAAKNIRLRDLSFTTTCRRDHHDHRLAIVADSVDEVVAGLLDHVAQESSGHAITGSAADAPAIGFIFSGQGSQWRGMGRELMKSAPVFAEWMERCDALLRPLTGWSLLDVIGDDDAARLERVDIIQPTLTCFQIALAEQLRAWGVTPRAVAGHSMGEVAAAYCAGALRLEDALRIVASRSRLLSGIAGAGAMALIDLTEGEVAQLLTDTHGISIAAINGPRSTVISGDPAAIDELLDRLDGDGVFCRRVKVDVASHSAQTDPLLAPLRAELSAIEPATPRAAFHSTARPGAPTDALLGADYWVDNLRQPVRLMAAVQRMIEEGVDTFVEIAPHPVLLSSLADIAAESAARIRTYAGPRREEPEMRRSLELLSRLHVCGASIAWHALAAPDARVISTPAYPWQRERHWLDNWEDWSGSSGAAASAPRPALADSAVHAVEWTPLEPAATRDPEGVWLIVSNGSSTADACGELLNARGATVEQVRVDGIGATLARINATPNGIIDLTSFEAGAGTALATAQALLAAGIEASTWWITRGVQTLPSRSGDVDAWRQAATWGIARTLWQEHPELDAHIVDVDGDASAAAQQIVAALTTLHEEPQVAFAGDVAHGARLVRAGRDALPAPASWRADGACLITGGLGALGLIVAEELIAGGARRLILMSRTALPPRRQWSSLAPGPIADRVAGVQRLESLGASVHVAAVDVGDAGALSAWLEEYRAEGWPAIRCVVHCAGVLDNHLVRDLDAASLDALMRGKPLAAANIARLIPDVERTIYFSSTVPVLPQAGQANYAAANAALDAMAAARTAAGQPTVSLAWGVWKDAGLVADAKVQRYVETMEAAGLGSLEASEARALFRWAAATTRPHLVFAPIDWSAAATRIANRPGSRFYVNLLEAGSVAAGPSLRDAIDNAPPSARRGLLVEHLRALVARVLDVKVDAVSPAQPLGRQGLDSLMAMEFRNRLEAELGIRLPASLTWNYPLLDGMAAHLLERMYASANGASSAAAILEAPVAAQAPTVDVGLDPRIRAEVNALSDDELLQQLRDA